MKWHQNDSTHQKQPPPRSAISVSGVGLGSVVFMVFGVFMGGSAWAGRAPEKLSAPTASKIKNSFFILVSMPAGLHAVARHPPFVGSASETLHPTSSANSAGCNPHFGLRVSGFFRHSAFELRRSVNLPLQVYPSAHRVANRRIVRNAPAGAVRKWRFRRRTICPSQSACSAGSRRGRLGP